MLSDGLMMAKIENVTTSGHFEAFGQVGATDLCPMLNRKPRGCITNPMNILI
jgi:hypothetical protein